ncbi:unnamed protein product [Laminaria digitata]
MSAVYCKLHAEDGMVDVYLKRCLHDSCTKAPSYNFEGRKPAVYCKKHAEDGMVGVYGRRCLHDSCTKRPGYNFKGNKSAYCKQHAEDGMVDVLHRRCLHKSCRKIPSFNFEGEIQAYCKQHAEDGMVDVRSKRSKRSPNVSCTAIGASPLPSTDDVPTVCALLKKEILDDPVKSVNVETLCDAVDCLKKPGCGMDGKQLTRCLDHAPLEDGLADPVSVVGMALTKGDCRSSSLLGSRAHLDYHSDGGGTAAKRTRHRLYRRPLPS